MFAPAAALIVAAVAVDSPGATALWVDVDRNFGNYTLYVDGRAWLVSAPPTYPGTGGLTLNSYTTNVKSRDRIGNYSATVLNWTTTRSRSSPAVLQTSFKMYNASLITFSQTYLVGIANTTLYFNTSEGAPVTTCSPYTDRVLPPSDTLSTPRSSSDNLRGKHLLPRTTAQALGAFPSFQLHDTHADGFPRLNWFAPQGNQLSATAFGRFAKAGPLGQGGFHALNGQASMPLLLYDANLTTVALFPIASFFAAVHETVTSADVLSIGPAASIVTIPKGYVYTTALLSAETRTGLTGTMVAAGDFLLTLGGKPRPNPYTDSFILSHLGFWVDNGSPYYHRNDSYAMTKGLEACNAALNCTLEDGLRAVQADAAERKIPLRYYQFDDHESLDAYHWPETLTTPYLNSESFSQINAGDVVFQSGVAFLGKDPWNASARSRFPLALYIGHGDTRPCFYDTGTPFPGDHDGPRCSGVQNKSISGYEWVDGVCTSESFFEGLMANGTEAGMKMFEQDYLCATQATTASDLTTGERWFAGMDAAVRKAGIDLQLCMMYPAHALASTTMLSATNGRGTEDHADRSVSNGLPLGWSSLVLFSLGLWPSRDNVWTNSSVGGGASSKWLMREEMPVLQSTMAVLAGGPYGPADIAGTMNRSLVMRACRIDGVLLRPSWPATAIDFTFKASFDNLEPIYLWAARSTVGNGAARTEYVFTYVLSINSRADVDVPITALADDAAAFKNGQVGWAVFDGWYGIQRAAIAVVGNESVVKIPATPQEGLYKAGHSLTVIAPILSGGWSFLGEVDKIVKASGRRVRAMSSTTAGGLLVDLLLAPNESAEFGVLAAQKVLIVTCDATSVGIGLHVVQEPFGDVDVPMTLACQSHATQTDGHLCSCTGGSTGHQLSTQ